MGVHDFCETSHLNTINKLKIKTLAKNKKGGLRKPPLNYLHYVLNHSYKYKRAQHVIEALH
jgi:hypothetical protein